MILRTLWRLVVVCFAFFISAMAAGIVLVTLGLEKATQAINGVDVTASNIDSAMDMLMAAVRLMSAVTVLPALALVIVGEVARIRSSLFYVIGGGLALAAIPLLARFGSFGSGPVPGNLVWQIFATAGFAGGLAYWLLAGRKA
jgi:hypothetical protein